jgi:hypothetical protein
MGGHTLKGFLQGSGDELHSALLWNDQNRPVALDDGVTNGAHARDALMGTSGFMTSASVTHAFFMRRNSARPFSSMHSKRQALRCPGMCG